MKGKKEKWIKMKMNEKLSNFLSSLPVQLICRFLFGGVFIYAAISKITHLHAFAKIIHNYQILPDQLVYFPAIILPWLEIICGLLLIFGVFQRPAALLLTGMLLVFIVAISFNLIRGLNFDCGCFSTTSTESGSDPVGLLIRDLLLLIPAAVTIFFEPRKNEFPPTPQTA